MPRDARAVLKDDPIMTTSLQYGLMNPEQADKFLTQIFEKTSLINLCRHETRIARTGEIDKIGINRRIVREKVENADNGYRANIKTDVIKYSTTAIRLPFEITGETLRENIERAALEAKITDLMTTQLALDFEDLHINGDESVSEDDTDYDFLKINTGWIPQLLTGTHVVDASGYSAMKLDMFYDAVRAIPNKYNNGNLVWVMSPHRRQQWEQFLLNQIIEKGGAVPQGIYTSPVSIPIVQVPIWPDDKVALLDPKNLISVTTYNIALRSTREGKHALYEDKTFYVTFMDYDPVIEELDATAMLTGLPDMSTVGNHDTGSDDTTDDSGSGESNTGTDDSENTDEN